MLNDLFVLSDLVDTVGHELAIITLVVNPVKCDSRIEPTMKRRGLISECGLSVRHEVCCHMSRYQFETRNC